jgi:serine/threonine protein kinase
MKAPSQWPKDLSDTYEPVRDLGSGAFGSVVLARSKQDDGASSKFVAVKVVGSATYDMKDIEYAHREIDILKELDHPNIVKLLKYWEAGAKSSSDKCAAVMSLSFVQGPTVLYLLQRGGAFSQTFARIVTAQLIDAVAYLHSRAVIHRDIKPDNIIVTGALDSQNEIWEDTESDISNATKAVDANTDKLRALTKKWHVTLIDFGFARALSPTDLARKPANLSSRALNVSDRSLMSGSRRSLRGSISGKIKRSMSAVGNRIYAAPEVQHGVRQEVRSRHVSVDITRTLSEYVSFYGLTADAFSVGNTIKHMYTGVLPHMNVDQVIAMENSPISMIFRCLFNSNKKKQQRGERVIQYRAWSKVALEVVKLIKGLTDTDPNKRTSVRAARQNSYIDDVLDSEPIMSGQVDYLSFTLQGQIAAGY